MLAVPPGVEKTELYRNLGVRGPPLGLAWIAAVLEQYGYEVRILDSPTEGLSEDEFRKILQSWNPDLVGISSLTPTIYLAYNAAKIVKDVNREIKVVIGGPHATFMWKEVLEECPYIDYVVIGEGEYTTLDLVKALERKEKLSKVRGLAFRNEEGTPVRTESRPLIKNLNELPPPARHLLPMDKYTFLGKPISIIHVMASRGCPYGCIFCSTSYFFGRRVRFRSPKLVADEIEDAVYKYKTNIVTFSDDEFTINHKWLLEFLDELKKRKLDLSWSCGSRVDTVNREILRKMYEAGCNAIYYGVESGSQETLNKIGKRITIEQAEKCMRITKETGIPYIVGTFVLGFPWETIDDMKNTVKFAIKLDPNYAQFTIATPYPGTPLYEVAKRENLIEDRDWSHYTTLRPVMRGYYFLTRDLTKMLTYAYRKFYLRARFLWRQVRTGVFRDLFRIITKNLIVPAFKSTFSYFREKLIKRQV